jgi:hypothetical protein
MVDKRPNFFIVGAPKSGTTAIADFLAQHPEVFFFPHKEYHYFGKDLNFFTEYPELKEYLSYFDFSGDHKIYAEASVNYLFSQKAAQEIYKLNPGSKILICLRNPVDMVYSLFYQNLTISKNPIKTKNFEEALEISSKLTRANPCSLAEGPVLLEMGNYYMQVKRYLDLFKENVFILFFDDFKSDNRKAFRNICRFLDIDADFEPQFKQVNPFSTIRSIKLRDLKNSTSTARRLISPYVPDALWNFFKKAYYSVNNPSGKKPPMKESTRTYLTDYYRNDIEKLKDILNKDIVW